MHFNHAPVPHSKLLAEIFRNLFLPRQKGAGHIKNTVVLIFQHIHCLHLMYSEVAWVLISSGTQVRSQIILDPDYLPDYLSVSYNNDLC